MKYFYIILCFLFSGIVNSYSISYYQCRTGNWNNPDTWTTYSSWQSDINTGTYPQAGDDVHLANNGSNATITLTADAECANLYFDGSEPSCVISMGNYNLTVAGSWTTNWSSNATISQGSGYLQVNSIPQFYTEKTISNFRVGSGSFGFTQTNSISLIVTSNYDYNCFQSTIPSGISANNAVKYHATPCEASLSATTLDDFGSICTGYTTNAQSIIISGVMLSSENITVESLDGFSYSTSLDGTYSNTLTLIPDGDRFTKTIYVKFSPIATISYNGNIVISGGGAGSINVVASGSGSNSVNPSIDSPVASNIMSASATLGATISIAGCSTDYVTERGFYYSTTNGFADGTGTKISETGTFGTGSFLLDVSDLSASTTYYYKAFATNSNGTVYSLQADFNNVPMTYYSRQTGDWTNTSTWSTTGCGELLNSGTFPHSVDNVVICQEHNITVNTTGLSCNNVDMSTYAGRLILAADFTINGNLLLTNQSSVSIGAYNLNIAGNFSNIPNEYNSRIDYSTGNITIGGNIIVAKGGGSYEPFNCTSTGWLVLSGEAKTFTANTDIQIPRFKQPTSSFTKAGTGIITISNIFDQNSGPDAPAGVVISNPNNTLNIPVKYFRSANSGNWNSTSSWQQSINQGASWETASTVPDAIAGMVTIQNEHTVTLTENTTINDLTINGTLTINARKQFTCISTLTNNGSLQLLSDATGTSTLIDGTTFGNGTSTIQQYLTSGRNWYLSIPVTASTTGALSGASTVVYWNENAGNWTTVTAGSEIYPLIGYVSVNTNTTTPISFNGTLNTGDKQVTVTHTAGKTKEGFNLIGNPYPSYLNPCALITASSKMEKTLWYRTYIGGTYYFETLNTTSGIGTNISGTGAVTGFIPPMQAFWVRVLKDGANNVIETLNFTNAMRSHESGTNRIKVPASKNTDQRILRLQFSNGTNWDETVIYTNPNASNEFDEYDSKKMSNANGSVPEIYSMVDNEQIAINGLNSINIDTEIMLGITPDSSHEFTLKASEVSNFDMNVIRIMLKDNTDGAVMDITDGSPYNFISNSAIPTTNRFTLYFKSPSFTTGENQPFNEGYSESDITVVRNGDNQIVVNYTSELTDESIIEVYNVTGQRFIKTEITDNRVIFNEKIPAGVYLVTVRSIGKKFTKKIILN